MTDPFADLKTIAALKTIADMMCSADRIRKVSGDAGEFFFSSSICCVVNGS